MLSLVTLLKTYDLVVSLTGGGPAGSTQTAAYLILWDSFHDDALGFGSAQSRRTDARHRRARSHGRAAAVAGGPRSEGMSAIRMPRSGQQCSPACQAEGLRTDRVPVVTSVLMLVPMYLLVVNAFKRQQDILQPPVLGLAGPLTTEHLRKAWTNPDFNILKGVRRSRCCSWCSVNVLSVALAAPGRPT